MSLPGTLEPPKMTSIHSTGGNQGSSVRGRGPAGSVTWISSRCDDGTVYHWCVCALLPDLCFNRTSVPHRGTSAEKEGRGPQDLTRGRRGVRRVLRHAGGADEVRVRRGRRRTRAADVAIRGGGAAD